MKKCFKCGKEKDYSEYYKHPKMGDGYLGKCKSCAKNDSNKRFLEKLKDLEWVEKELERHRIKSEKARAAGKKASKESFKKGRMAWDQKNKHKKYAQGKVAMAIKTGKIKKEPCSICGNENSEAHHEDYSRPLYIIWLCKKHHMERHVQLRKMERETKFQIENSTI
jgi:hypothetical protein